jgi:hypothetical protein
LYGCIITDGVLARSNDESFSIRKSSDNGDDSIKDINTIEIKTYKKRIRKAISFLIQILYGLITKRKN